LAKKKSQAPAWVWLFTGIVTGLFIAFLYHLAGVRTPTRPEPAKKPVTTRESKPQPKYDFYNMLPDKKVAQPESTRAKPTQADTKPDGKSDPIPSQTILQTGAFRTQAEADHRRAELILLGLDVKVQKVETKPGDIWHRVQLGPFESEEKLKNAKTMLADNHIEYMLVRLK
jgi:cell division protein FtsN